MKLQDKIKERLPVIAVNECEEDIFESSCKELVDSGYSINSSSCGFVNSEEYNFCLCFCAVFTLNSEGGE